MTKTFRLNQILLRSRSVACGWPLQYNDLSRTGWWMALSVGRSLKDLQLQKLETPLLDSWGQAIHHGQWVSTSPNKWRGSERCWEDCGWGRSWHRGAGDSSKAWRVARSWYCNWRVIEYISATLEFWTLRIWKFVGLWNRHPWYLSETVKLSPFKTDDVWIGETEGWDQTEGWSLSLMGGPMCTLFEETHALHVGSTLASLWIQFALVLLY